MRKETRTARQLITAEIFNKLEGPGAEPVSSFIELAVDQPPAEIIEQWKSIQAAVERLPTDVVAALCDMLREMGDRRARGHTDGLVRAARIVNQGLQPELARDLLIEAGITSAEDLKRSGTAGDDISACLPLFRGDPPSPEEIAAATRRNRPTTARSTMFQGPTVISNR